MFLFRDLLLHNAPLITLLLTAISAFQDESDNILCLSSQFRTGLPTSFGCGAPAGSATPPAHDRFVRDDVVVVEFLEERDEELGVRRVRRAVILEENRGANRAWT